MVTPLLTKFTSDSSAVELGDVVGKAGGWEVKLGVRFAALLAHPLEDNLGSEVGTWIEL